MKSDLQKQQQINDLTKKVDYLIDLVASLSNGFAVSSAPSCKYTFHDWLDEWLTTFKAPNVKQNTLYTLEVAIRVHIKPNLPNVALNLISGLELQKFLTKLSDKSRTRKTVFDVLNGSFREAVILKLISDNPMLAVKIPAHIREQGSNLNVEELNAFLNDIKGHPLENLFLFLLFTGCRRNEALTLNIADVDFKNKQIHIKGTKTKLSDRILPLFNNVASLLVDLKPNKDGFFFPFRPDYPTHAFKKICPTHKLHDLRHTFATRCLEAKIPLKVVQTWLGHSEINTTADIYSHVTTELNLLEAQRFNEFQCKKDT